MTAIKKRGRPPIENPALVKLTVRVHKEEIAALDEYCQRMELSRADGVRRALLLLRENLKEKKAVPDNVVL